MPRMDFGTILAQIETITNLNNQDTLIKNGIQWGLDQLTDFDLPYLMDESYITTVAPYETGTISVTNNSKTVTGSGTTFTAAMVGRKIRFASQEAYYKIATYSSATSITLETVYAGTTLSGETYSIYKDEYKLIADLDRYKVFRQVENGIALGSIQASAFDIYDPMPSSAGDARYEVLVGTKLDTYTTGTVAGTVNLSVLTGTSTNWTSVEGLSRGSRIVADGYTYTVKSVDSDTQITIYEKLSTTLSADTYTAHLDNVVILIKDIPDEVQNIYYRYQRSPFPLINDNDIPDLPEKFHHLLVRYGLAYAWQAKDKEEANKQLIIATNGRAEMWKRIGSLSSVRSYRRRSMDYSESSSRTGQPLPPSSYGIPIEL